MLYFHCIVQLIFFLNPTFSFRRALPSPRIAFAMVLRQVGHFNPSLELRSQAASTPNPAAVTFNKIFIGNLPFSITEDALKCLVEDIVGVGMVTRVQVAVGSKSRAPRGFAFVDLIDEQLAIEAAEALNEVTYEGRPLTSNVYDNAIPGRRARTRINQHTVFVSNLDVSLDEVQILDMCADMLGSSELVVSLQMPLDLATGRRRGKVFIEFRDKSISQQAVQQLNGLEVLGRILKCEPYQPKKVEKVEHFTSEEIQVHGK
jgi:RNA recognition motif-containing protein